MNKILNNVKAKLGFLGAIFLATVVGGITSATVLAAIPDSNGQINACYKNSNGAVQLTDPAGNCGSKFTAISWSQHAPTVISNRIEVATSTSGQALLTVPGFGDFNIADCDDAQSAAAVMFTNTSSGDVDFGVPNDQAASSPQLVLPPSGSWTQASTQAATGITNITIGKGTGSGSSVASIQLYTQNSGDGVHSGCRFMIQAIFK